MNELSTKDLKEYLFHVRDLEVSCYKQREYINFLQQSMNKANNPQMNAMIKDRKTKSDLEGIEGCGLCLSIGMAGAIIFAVLGFFNKWFFIKYVPSYNSHSLLGFLDRIFYGAIAGFLIGFFGSVIVKIIIKMKNHISDKAENQKRHEQNKELAEKMN